LLFGAASSRSFRRGGNYQEEVGEMMKGNGYGTSYHLMASPIGWVGLVANIMVIARISGYWQDVILGIILIVTLWADKELQKKYASSL
jgi:predicted ABC-type sugar transport system permease subunit